MKTIQLSQGKVALIDDEDYCGISKYKWSYNSHGRAVRTEYPSKKNIYMAREIMGHPIGLEIDHIDGDRLNNRKGNLRIATHAENGRNIHKKYYKGIYHTDNPKNKKHPWKASITFQYKNIHIGCYKTETEAAKAYDKKAKELFGTFACFNFKENVKENSHENQSND